MTLFLLLESKWRCVNMLKINEMNNVFSIFQGAGRKIPGGATLVFQVEMVAFL